MATLPRFVFPLRHDQTSNTEANPDTSTTRKRKPQISLQTLVRQGKGYALSVPDAGYQRPGLGRAISTPPDSPTRPRSYTLGATGSTNMHDSGAMTPPPTPTRSSHSKSNPTSSFRDSFEGLRRGDSTSSRSTSGQTFCTDTIERPGSTEPRPFPYWETDYEVVVDQRGRKKPLGDGTWSKVYLARPCLPQEQEPTISNVNPGTNMTPPITPCRSRTTSLTHVILPQMPPAYAVKEPDRQTASPKVLEQESRILSYLSRFPDADKHIIPFYGLDARTGALVLKAMDGTLEDWIHNTLNVLPEDARAARLAEAFPSIASHLLAGLAWLGEKECTHGDLKPANILTSTSPSSPTPQVVYTDFSSAVLSAIPQASVGGATWDFLDPSLMTKATASNPPTPATDLWSLAITLLFLVIGSSPYDRLAPNSILKREYMKQGNPLLCMKQSGNALRNVARINALSKSLGFDVTKWFSKVLIKDVEKRVGVAEWRDDLERGIAQRFSKI